MKLVLPAEPPPEKTHTKLPDDLAQMLGYDPDDEIMAPERMTVQIRLLMQHNEALIERLERQEKQLTRLSEYIDDLLFNIRAIERSKAWWLGDLVIGNLRLLLGKSRHVRTFADANAIAAAHHHWKKSRD